MIEGYIKIYRQLLEWEWYDDIPTKVLFIHCLLKANFRDYKYRWKDYPKWSFISGRLELSKQTGLTERQIRTALNKLKTTSELTVTSTSTFSVIQLLNWEMYQDTKTSKTTSERPATDQRATTGEEGKKGRREERETDTLVCFDIFWNEYPHKVGKPNAMKKYRDKEHSDIIQGLTLWKQYWESSNTEQRYIPHPATWLNQERWKDTPPESASNHISL